MTRRRVVAGVGLSRAKHEAIIEKVMYRFKKEGYHVFNGMAPVDYIPELQKLLGEDRVKSYFQDGSRKDLYPDVVAIKGKDVFFIEVKDQSERFVRQIGNYSKLAKTILVVEADVSNLEVRNADDFN